MIELFNGSTPQGWILSQLIDAKGVDCMVYAIGSSYTPKAFEGEPTIVDKGHVIYGGMVGSLYIEQRYPSPCLLPQDPKRASMVLMLYRAILNRGSLGSEEDVVAYKAHIAAHGFIDGDRPTLADIAIAALAPRGVDFWDSYRDNLRRTYGSWSETHEDV